MVSKLTYFAIVASLLLFGFFAAIPELRANSVYVLFGAPLVVGLVNGVELIQKKDSKSGMLLIAAVVVLVVSVIVKWKS